MTKPILFRTLLTEELVPVTASAQTATDYAYVVTSALTALCSNCCL